MFKHKEGIQTVHNIECPNSTIKKQQQKKYM